MQLRKSCTFTYQINEHKNTSMFIVVIIYFTNIFKDNHIFLFGCLHSTLATIIETLTNSTSFNKNNTCFYYNLQMRNHKDIIGCLILVFILYIKLLFLLQNLFWGTVGKPIYEYKFGLCTCSLLQICRYVLCI